MALHEQGRAALRALREIGDVEVGQSEKELLYSENKIKTLSLRASGAFTRSSAAAHLLCHGQPALYARFAAGPLADP